MQNDEPRVDRHEWGYCISWWKPLPLPSAPEYVMVTRCYTTSALYCHACHRSGRTPCIHLQFLVAYIHRKIGTA